MILFSGAMLKIIFLFVFESLMERYVSFWTCIYCVTTILMLTSHLSQQLDLTIAQLNLKSNRRNSDVS